MKRKGVHEYILMNLKKIGALNMLNRKLKVDQYKSIGV
jgi:hypothetical protein